MKENQQACGEQSRTISQIKQNFLSFSLCNSVFTLRNSVFLFLFAACLTPLQMVLAHGGGELQISNAPIGEYQVSVWNNPPTARAGQAIHVTVGIAQADSGEPVLDTAVTVTIMNESGQPIATAAATTEQSINRLFYEADLTGVPIGSYEMQIEVMGSQGSGTLSFPLTVQPVSVWPWLTGVVAAGGIIWLVLRYWRKGSVAGRGTAVPQRRSVD